MNIVPVFLSRLYKNLSATYLDFDVEVDSAGKEEWKSWYLKWQTQVEGNIQELGTSMCDHNPKVILRNHLLHQVIEQLSKGETEKLRRVERMIEKPFDDWAEENELLQSQPDWAANAEVAMNSCSS